MKFWDKFWNIFRRKTPDESKQNDENEKKDKIDANNEIEQNNNTETQNEDIEIYYIDENELQNQLQALQKQEIAETDEQDISADEIYEAEYKVKKYLQDILKKDTMLETAIDLATETGYISTSMLQRRLRLGYARAGRLIKVMELLSIIEPPTNSAQRKALMTYEEWQELKKLFE